MLLRLLPLIGGFLVSRGARRGAGGLAGKLTLAFGAWELWKTYKSSQAKNEAKKQAKAQPAPVEPEPAPKPKTVRKKKRLL